MSIKVYCGKASKRVNSTLQPPYGGWESFNAVWKRPTDPNNPIVELYRPTGGTPDWNMLYMEETQAWYWITGIVSTRANVWLVSATMDYLATYKSDIMSTMAYILYGSNADASSTFRVVDSRQNCSNIPVVNTTEWDISDGNLTRDGIYILSAVGKQNGVVAYAVYGATLQRLIDKVNEDLHQKLATLEGRELTEFININQLFQGSAIQCIRNCRWIPVKMATAILAGSTDQKIYLGDFDSGVNGYALKSNPVHVVETDIDIPWPVGDWRRMNSQISIYIPFIGTVSIPIDQCNNASTIHSTWSYSLITGEMSVRLESNDYTIYVGSTITGADYAIGSSNVPTQNIINGALQEMHGGLQMGGGILGASAASLAIGATAGLSTLLGKEQDLINSSLMISSGVQNAAQGFLQMITPVVSCTGTLGGSAAIGQSLNAKLSLFWYPPIDDPGFSAIYQHPVMRIATPQAGYCQTRGFSLVGSARVTEAVAINQAMDGGVFIE